MTASIPALETWAKHPVGFAVRVAIAVTGMVTAILVLMTSSLIPGASWVLVGLGIALAAASVRAARVPSATRLAVAVAILVAVPLSIQIF